MSESESLRRQKHEYYLRNRLSILAKVKSDYLANPEAHRKKRRESWARNAVRVNEERRAKWQERRRLLRELFGNICAICGRGRDKALLVFHHLSYPNGKPKRTSVDIREVEASPSNFRLLCERCHFIVTLFLKVPEIASGIQKIVEGQKHE